MVNTEVRRVSSHKSYVLLAGCLRAAFWLIFSLAPYIGGFGRSLWNGAGCASSRELRRPNSQAPPAFEVWAGAEVFHQVWSLYAGGTYAPFGSVRKDGFRVRAVAGYGAYSYASPRWTGASTQALEFHGTTSFADLLAGYHKQLGPLTIKFLAGLTVARPKRRRSGSGMPVPASVPRPCWRRGGTSQTAPGPPSTCPGARCTTFTARGPGSAGGCGRRSPSASRAAPRAAGTTTLHAHRRLRALRVGNRRSVAIGRAFGQTVPAAAGWMCTALSRRFNVLTRF